MIGQLFSKLHPNYDLMVVNHAFLFNLNTNSFMIITQYLTFSHDIFEFILVIIVYTMASDLTMYF